VGLDFTHAGLQQAPAAAEFARERPLRFTVAFGLCQGNLPLCGHGGIFALADCQRRLLL